MSSWRQRVRRHRVVVLVVPVLLGIAVVLPGSASAATCTSRDAIDLRYCQVGGAGSYLGLTRGATYTVPGGRAHDYAGGSIYWSSATGAHVVRGVILTKYKALGGPASVLRFPTTDELGTPNVRGAFNHFSAGGSIYWSPATGAQEIHGAIRTKWAQLGWEQGILGFPTTDELATPNNSGAFNHFSKAGSIYWSPATGAHEVHGAIRTKWASLGSQAGVLGFPTSDEFGITAGRRNSFVHGTVDSLWPSGTNVTADPREYWVKEPLTSAAAWQRSFNGFHTSQWSGADGAGPVTLPDGRQALLFGDTLQGSVGANGAFLTSPPMVDNSMLTVDPVRMRSVPGPKPGSFVPADSDGAIYWPTGGVSVGNRLWLVCTRTYRTPGQGFGFRVSGTRLAAFDFPTAGADPVFRGIFTMPGNPGAFNAAGDQVGIAWDGAMVADGGYVYTYGTRPRPMGSPLGNDLFLSRVPAGSLATPSAWTYFTGTGWSSSSAAAASLLAPGGTGTPGSFSLARTAGGWVIDGKANGIFSVGISTWASPSLTGPWTQRPDVVAGFPAKTTPDEYTYGGYRLPAFPLSSGRSLFAYSRNSGQYGDLVANSNRYMPQFLEVDGPAAVVVPPPPPILPTPPPTSPPTSPPVVVPPPVAVPPVVVVPTATTPPVVTPPPVVVTTTPPPVVDPPVVVPLAVPTDVVPIP